MLFFWGQSSTEPLLRVNGPYSLVKTDIYIYVSYLSLEWRNNITLMLTILFRDWQDLFKKDVDSLSVYLSGLKMVVSYLMRLVFCVVVSFYIQSSAWHVCCVCLLTLSTITIEQLKSKHEELTSGFIRDYTKDGFNVSVCPVAYTYQLTLHVKNV